MGHHAVLPQDRQQIVGTTSGMLAFLIWGLLPFYWKWLGSVSAAEILSHRVVWSALLLLVLVPTLQRRELAAAVRDRWALLVAAAAGVLVGGNWYIYTWAVNADRLVEASLGYYINPLVSVLLGVIVLRERLNRTQAVAVAIAAVGVLVLAVSYGRFPWVSLGLAFSFALYGLVKKTGRLNSMVSLLVELVVIAPIALVFLMARHSSGVGAFGAAAPSVTWLLAGAGIVTITPLLLFGTAARRIPLSRVGFLQYIAPTLMLLIGTVFYGEPFTAAHGVSFALIWTALGIYTVTLIRGRAHVAVRPADA
jgi:chloramphenicol-sensitive protein RarD